MTYSLPLRYLSQPASPVEPAEGAGFPVDVPPPLLEGTLGAATVPLPKLSQAILPPAVTTPIAPRAARAVLGLKLGIASARLSATCLVGKSSLFLTIVSICRVCSGFRFTRLVLTRAFRTVPITSPETSINSPGTSVGTRLAEIIASATSSALSISIALKVLLSSPAGISKIPGLCSRPWISLAALGSASPKTPVTALLMTLGKPSLITFIHSSFIKR